MPPAGSGPPGDVTVAVKVTGDPTSDIPVKDEEETETVVGAGWDTVDSSFRSPHCPDTGLLFPSPEYDAIQ
jgi:hypothetical protein